MSQRYTEEEKEIALDQLVANGGNIPLTSAELNIPERTLYNWRREMQHALLRQQQHTPPPSPPSPADLPVIPAEIDDVEALIALHDNLIAQLQQISVHATTGIEFAAPYQRVLALSELIRNIHALKNTIAQHLPAPGLRVQFIQPDGSTSDHPYWRLPRNRAGEDE